MKTQNPLSRCDGVTRRDLLRVGGLTALGLGIPDIFSMRQASAGQSGKAKSCILIWLDGGPSHLETFDLKPNAPKEVRGPLEPISTSIPGVQISECLPQIAQRMDKITVVRSMTSPLGEHNFGTHYLLTGYKPTPVLQHPSFHAVGTHLHASRGVLPSNVAIPQYRVGGGRFSGSGFLSASARPFSVGGDPAKPDFRVRDMDFYHGLDIHRLDRRRQFIQRLDQFSGSLDGDKTAAPDPHFEQAWRLITSNDAKKAFDLNDEPRPVRQRYGARTIGQSCLLARRLVERGVPFVTVVNRGWDTHNNLYTRLKEGYTGAKRPVGLIPSLDLAFSALIDDLKDRNLLNETLIVVMGEFGRTPKLNTAGGRDHWPRVFSVALAGGGVPGGKIVGTSDSVGEGPKDNPVTPSDLIATIYTLLGIDPSRELHTADGRPVRLTPHNSHVVSELLA